MEHSSTKTENSHADEYLCRLPIEIHVAAPFEIQIAIEIEIDGSN